MDEDVRRLINLTTIVKVLDYSSRDIIFGSEYAGSHLDRKVARQFDLQIIESNWENLWKSFYTDWNHMRQNYRFFYNSFMHFYYSFQQLHRNKIECNMAYDDYNEMLHFNRLSGTSLYGMYSHGKKCIDLLKTLQQTAEHPDLNFINKFCETRNKLLEHNHNPRNFDLQLDPAIWSLASTNSFLEIHVHKHGRERAYDLYVDYYDDYFKLEKIISDIIRQF